MMTKFFHITFYGFFFLFLFQKAFAYDCLTDSQKETLLLQTTHEFMRHPRLLYTDDESGRIEFSGFVTSNELNYGTIDPSKKADGDLYFGLGSTSNFNLLGIRAGKMVAGPDGRSTEVPRTAIFSDQSQEVLIAMTTVWKAVFLISETPEEWVANLGGFELREGLTLDLVFDSTPIQRPELKHSDAAARILNEKLNEQVRRGLLLPWEAKFALHLILEEANGCREKVVVSNSDLFEGFSSVGPNFPSMPLLMNSDNTNLLGNIKVGHDLRRRKQIKKRALRSQILDAFRSSFDLPGTTFDLVAAETLAEIEASEREALLSHTAVSFLHDRARFSRVRSIYLAQQDYYAHSLIADQRLWDVLRGFSVGRELRLTDAYLSCIAGCGGGDCLPSNTDPLLSQMPFGMEGIQLFEYHCKDGLEKGNMTVRILHPQPAGEGSPSAHKRMRMNGPQDPVIP